MLKTRGYATGDLRQVAPRPHAPFLPPRHGFDEYFGLPYSNDMWPKHPQQQNFYPDLPLIDGDEVIELNPDQTQLTTMYTERAVRFIERNGTAVLPLRRRTPCRTCRCSCPTDLGQDARACTAT